jgi:tape measure domain-containing protein
MASTVKTVSELELKGYTLAKKQIESLVKARKSFEAPPKRGTRLLSSGAETQIKNLVKAKQELQKPWKIPKVRGLADLNKAAKLKFTASGINTVATGIQKLIALKRQYETPARTPFRGSGGGRPGSRSPRASSRGGGVASGMANAAAVAPQAAKGVLGYAASLGKMAGPAAAAVAVTAALSLGMFKVVGATSAAADEVTSWTQTLTFATGSQEQANNQILFASDLANNLGADVKTLTQEYSRFAAATKSTTLEGKKADDLFASIARGVQIVGGNADKAFLALTQMASKPRLSLEELQQQLAEALPGSVQIFADAVGMTRGEFVQLVAQGKVMSADVLPKVAIQMQKAFGSRELIMRTSMGVNRVRNSIFELSAGIGKELSPMIGTLLTKFAAMLDASSPFIQFWASEGLQTLKMVWAGISELGEALELYPRIIEPAVTGFMNFTDEFSKIGGITGLAHHLSAAITEASANAVAFAGNMTEHFMGALARAARMLSDLMLALEDMPGIGSFAGKVSKDLDDLTIAFNMTGKKAKKDLEPVEQTLRDMSKISLEKAMNSVTGGINEASTATRGLNDNVNNLTNAAEKAHPAVQALADELATFEKVGSLMDEFGISADEAMEAAKILAKDGVKKTAEEVVKLVKELGIARDEFEDDTLAVKTYNDTLKELQRIQSVTDAVREFGVDAETAAEAVKLAADANMELGRAIEFVQGKQAATAALKFESEGSFLGVFNPTPEEIEQLTFSMVGVWEEGKTRIEAYREEYARLEAQLDNKDISQAQFDNAKKSLDAQMEHWEILGAKIADVAEKSGGVWKRMLEGLGGNLDDVSVALGTAANIAAREGEQQVAHLLSAAQSGIQGDFSGMAMSAVAATGFGQQKISKFGGRGEGNFVQEGMQIGSAFGGWGMLIGGVVGAFVKKGADDFHSHMEGVAGEANLVVTMAEGDLAEVADKIKTSVDGYLNAVQGMIGDTLDFDLSGFKIDIRGDEVTVLANGIQQTFSDLNQAIDFFIHGVLDAQENLAGLGPNMEAALKRISSTTTATGDTDRMMEALNIASALDFEETGVRQDLIAARERELRIIRDFGIPMEAYLDYKNQEMETLKRTLVTQAAGITDWAGNLEALAKQLDTVNNTTAAQTEIALKRKAEIEALMAAQSASVAATQQVTEATNVAAGSTLVYTQMSEDFDAAAQAAAMAGAGYNAALYQQGTFYGGNVQGIQQQTSAMDAQTQANVNAAQTAHQYQKELDLINAGLEGIPEGFDPEEMQRSIDAQVAGAAASIGNMILSFAEKGLIDLSADERIEIRKQLFELERVSAIAQLFATQTQIEAMLALGVVSANVTGILESFLGNIPNYLNQIANAGFKPGGNISGGGGRNKQRQEEQRRAAEEAQKTLEEFAGTLRTLELNASTATRTLGDLANQIDDINRRAQEALAAGADPADVRRFQGLEFSGMMRDTVSPFSSFGRDTFRDQSVDIEQQRRAAIEEARLIAEAKADALGVSFDVVFDRAEEEINSGAARMQRALTRDLIDSFGLPLQEVRKNMRVFGKQLNDLEQSYRAGNITQRRYKKLIKEIQDAQAAALSGDVLGMLDKYYTEVEGREDFRRQQAMANFELELATSRLRFDLLVAEGALAQESIDTIGGFISFMENNPPDWDKFFEGADGGAGGSFSSSFGGGFTGTNMAQAGVDLDALISSIRSFVRGFESINMGQFEQTAHDYISTIAGFQEELNSELADNVEGGSGKLWEHARKVARNFLGDQTLQLDDLTDEQLQLLSDADLSGIMGFVNGVGDVFDAMMALDEAEALKPKAIENILKAYKKIPQETSALAGEFRAINTDFADAMAALEMLGASESDLYEARLEHARQLLEFEQKALADIRAVGADIEGGQVFGNATARQRVGIAESRLAGLRARIEADPTDFEAIEAFGPAMREVLDARQQLTGGVGPEFTLALERIKALSESFELNLGDEQTAEEMAQATAEQHSALLAEQTDAINAGMANTTQELSAGFSAMSSAYANDTANMASALSNKLLETRNATLSLGTTLQPALFDIRTAASSDMEKMRGLAQQQLDAALRANTLLDRLDNHMESVDNRIANLVDLFTAGATTFQIAT